MSKVFTFRLLIIHTKDTKDKVNQGRLKRWTSQLDLGNTTGGLETVASEHNST